MVKDAENRDKPVVHVNFYLLDDTGLQGHFKSDCPVCSDGLLLGTRDQNSGELLAEDVCVLCGQRFVYDDIDLVRKAKGR